MKPTNSKTRATPSPAKWPICKVKPFLDYLQIECGLSNNTVIAYRRDLSRFDTFCVKLKLCGPEKITPLFLQEFARWLVEEKLSTASIARHISALKMFLKFHLLYGLMTKDICAEMESPKTWQRIPRVLDKKRTAGLLEGVDDKSPYCLRDRALLELLYATGMRATEIADIAVGDINFQIGYLRCIGKGRKERIIPVNKTARTKVMDYLEKLRPTLLRKKNSTALFLSRTGEPLNRITVWRIVSRAAQMSGLIGKVSPHTLRHCFGSHLLQGGADLRSVQEMLGHADVTTTQIYTHVDQEHIRAMHKQFHPRG
jgi:integrase/recombinase XerD